MGPRGSRTIVDPDAVPGGEGLVTIGSSRCASSAPGGLRGEAGLGRIDIEIGFGPLRVDVFEGPHEDLLDGEARVPLVIGGNDVPGGDPG